MTAKETQIKLEAIAKKLKEALRQIELMKKK